jgi:hypothetical protein
VIGALHAMPVLRFTVAGGPVLYGVFWKADGCQRSAYRPDHPARAHGPPVSRRSFAALAQELNLLNPGQIERLLQDAASCVSPTVERGIIREGVKVPTELVLPA